MFALSAYLGDAVGLRLAFPILNPLDLIFEVGSALEIADFGKANGVLTTSIHLWKNLAQTEGPDV